MPQTQLLTAATVMDQSAVLMNDAAKSIYPYSVQIPYLNMALQELQEYFQLNNIPVTDAVTSNSIPVVAGDSFIIPPHDLIEPKLVWESEAGQTNWTQMNRVESLPQTDDGVEISQFGDYVWADLKIKFLPSSRANIIKIDYIKALFAPVENSTEAINIINSASFLEYRTAGLLAEFCGENPTRAASLNSDALISLDRVLSIGTKGRQSMVVRRLPFRSSYKRNG